MAVGALALVVALTSGGQLAWRPNVSLRGSRRRSAALPARRPGPAVPAVQS
jgi:hypothetical protein